MLEIRASGERAGRSRLTQSPLGIVAARQTAAPKRDVRTSDTREPNTPWGPGTALPQRAGVDSECRFNCMASNVPDQGARSEAPILVGWYHARSFRGGGRVSPHGFDISVVERIRQPSPRGIAGSVSNTDFRSPKCKQRRSFQGAVQRQLRCPGNSSRLVDDRVRSELGCMSYSPWLLTPSWCNRYCSTEQTTSFAYFRPFTAQTSWP